MFIMNNKFNLTEEEKKQYIEEEKLNKIVTILNKDSNTINIFPNAQVADPLETSAALGKIWKIKIFLNQGFNINDILESGNTLLHIAAINGQLEMVRFLTENGADFKAFNKEGKTALDLVRNFINGLESGRLKNHIIPINRDYYGVLLYLETINQ